MLNLKDVCTYYIAFDYTLFGRRDELPKELQQNLESVRKLPPFLISLLRKGDINLKQALNYNNIRQEVSQCNNFHELEDLATQHPEMPRLIFIVKNDPQESPRLISTIAIAEALPRGSCPQGLQIRL